MEKRIIAILSVFCLLSLGLFLAEKDTAEKYKKKAGVYQSNTHALMQDIERYTIGDSMNVARINSLSLQLEEYKSLRKEDAETIKALKTKGREIERTMIIKSVADIPIHANLRDTIIIYKDTEGLRADTVQGINIVDNWYELHGIIKEGTFEGTICNYDDILVVVTGKKKRFLGFLWKTNKIKDRKVDIINRNPYTKIQETEYIEIF